MENKGTRWGWIVFWLIVFWPVGLFLLIKKYATDKSALMSGKTLPLSIIGWVLVVFGMLGFIGFVFDSSGDDTLGPAIMALAMAVGGVLLVSRASKVKKTAVIYKQYLDIVVNQNIRGIDDIASIVGLPYETVEKDLQDMVTIGYLKDAYIHQDKRAIVLKQHEPAAYPQQTLNGEQPAQTQAVRCSGCGANNIIAVGRISECEYCGTPINS